MCSRTSSCRSIRIARRIARSSLGQRVCQPGATIRWQQLVREGRCALVYEVDDDLLDVDPSNGPAWKVFGAPEIRANVIRNIEVAYLVTVSTEPLAGGDQQVEPQCDGPTELRIGVAAGRTAD
jgi:hypothetical protein